MNKDVETVQERRAALKAEIHLLDSDRQDLQNEIRQKEQRAKDKILPEIERVNRLIAEVNAEIAATQAKTEREEALNREVEAKIAAMDKDKD